MTDVEINPCYWPNCGGQVDIAIGSKRRRWASCLKCDASGPVCDDGQLAITAWNSLASRLKPEPKKVTVKRWMNVYANGSDFIVIANETEEQGRRHEDRDNYIDTVEVSITFTDSRGVV